MAEGAGVGVKRSRKKSHMRDDVREGWWGQMATVRKDRKVRRVERAIRKRHAAREIKEQL